MAVRLAADPEDKETEGGVMARLASVTVAVVVTLDDDVDVDVAPPPPPHPVSTSAIKPIKLIQNPCGKLYKLPLNMLILFIAFQTH